MCMCVSMCVCGGGRFSSTLLKGANKMAISIVIENNSKTYWFVGVFF